MFQNASKANKFTDGHLGCFQYLAIVKRVDPKTMVYLHNGILPSREREGAHTLCNSMDGTGEHYAKWNKPDGIVSRGDYRNYYKGHMDQIKGEGGSGGGRGVQRGWGGGMGRKGTQL